MPEIVGVRFERVGKVYYFAPGDLELNVGDYVIVETSRGREAGRVAIAPRQVLDSALEKGLEPVLRRATTQDLALQGHSRRREAQALARCREKVAEHGLHMQVVNVRYSFDGERLTVYFSAEQRVDFRELVRDLAQVLKTRVEMRQLGPRDEAKLLGGIGPCGTTEVCCASWLPDFKPISINMAKAQDLPLNPSSISGLCGRLRCCLRYEDDYYRVARELMPRVGQEIDTSRGRGQVISVNVIRETVQVKLKSEATVDVPFPLPIQELERRIRLREGTGQRA